MLAVKVSGPLFDGRIEHDAEELCSDITLEVAVNGRDLLDSNLNKVLKKQTPYYRTRIRVFRMWPSAKITDQGVVYGDWLEGTSKRNEETRFKGYATFRKTTQMIQARINSMGRGSIRIFIGRANR